MQCTRGVEECFNEAVFFYMATAGRRKGMQMGLCQSCNQARLGKQAAIRAQGEELAIHLDNLSDAERLRMMGIKP